MINKRGVIILLAIFLMILPIQVFAEGGNGGGNGGGNNQDNPITLESSNPENGAEDIDPDSSIVLNFSKNVVNMKVAEQNQSRFSMEDSKGNKVPITVEMADDQIEPEKKREISIKPKDTLEDGTEYKVIVKKGVQSKSGVKTDQSYEITFTTTKSTSSNMIILIVGIAIVILGPVLIMRKKGKQVAA